MPRVSKVISEITKMTGRAISRLRTSDQKRALLEIQTQPATETCMQDGLPLAAWMEACVWYLDASLEDRALCAVYPTLSSNTSD